MIIANAKETKGQLSLEIIRPDRKSHQFLTVASYAEAERIMIKMNREFIVEKITNYLRLRHYGLKLANQTYTAGEAAKLLVVINYHKLSSLNSLAKIVAQHAAVIEKLTPRLGSDQYLHYQKIIVPIINYCRSKNIG